MHWHTGAPVMAGVISMWIAGSTPSFAQTPGAGAKPPSQGAAAPAAAPAAADPDAAATKHYNDGIAAAKRENWPRAYESFLAAWKMKQHYQIAANLGRAELKVGKHRDAAEHLAYFLRESKGVSTQERALAQQMLAEAKAKVATLILVVNRPGAEVLVDGVAVGTAPLPDEVYVEAGSRTVEARWPGVPSDQVTVDLAAGGSRKVGLRIGDEPVAKADAPAPAEKPDEGGGSSPGTRTVLIRTGIGLSVAGIGVGAVMTALSFGKASERDDVCRDPGSSVCPESVWNDLEASRTTFADAALAGFVAGGLILGGTVVLAAIGPTAEEGSSTTVSVRMRTDGPGVMVTGAW